MKDKDGLKGGGGCVMDLFGFFFFFFFVFFSSFGAGEDINGGVGFFLFFF